MSVDKCEVQQGRFVEICVSGQLDEEDYEIFLPLLEEQFEEIGKIRLLFQLHEFRGWDAGALWEDTKFGAKHFSDIERLAVVGDKQWERGLTMFCKPFTQASVRYFDVTDIDEARQWLTE